MDILESSRKAQKKPPTHSSRGKDGRNKLLNKSVIVKLIDFEISIV